MNRSINIKGTVLDFTTPKVMGILNVTPDSFSDGGRYNGVEDAVNQAIEMQQAGASIIDVGGYSSRPGADEVTVQEELDRTILVIEKICNETDAFISIDTFRSEVAREAVQAGAHIVNDISAGEDDYLMLNTVGDLGVPYIAMHKKGVPASMQQNPEYDDVTKEVFHYLRDKISECQEYGIKDVIVDPGFGFGKTIDHNYTLLKEMETLRELGVPILVGLSRKSMIHKVLQVPASEAVNGTTFLHSLTLQNGANLLRVHDVKEAVECVRLWERINGLG